LKDLIAAAFAMLSISSASNALTLECKVPETNAGGGYVTSLYVFEYSDASGEALVADGWIMDIHDAPIAAKVPDDTKAKLVFTWNLVINNSSGQQTKMQYRAVYYKANKELVVRATPGGGYGGNFEGRGKCKAI
jgi:hypothetical protein